MNSTDRFEIRELIENWVVWRDAGDFDRLASVWHTDGRMITSWSQSTAEEFVKRSRTAREAGVKVLHSLGGSSVDVAGSRGIARTHMQITQRAPLHGVLVDVICQGIFFDAFEKREGRWGLILRQPIYGLDRIVPVDPSEKLQLDPPLLATFPEGYRHLAYLQTSMGFNVKTNLPCTWDPETKILRDRAAAWLAGGDGGWLQAKDLM